MGACTSVSVANDVATAVENAYTSVLSETNTSNQSVDDFERRADNRQITPETSPHNSDSSFVSDSVESDVGRPRSVTPPPRIFELTTDPARPARPARPATGVIPAMRPRGVPGPRVQLQRLVYTNPPPIQYQVPEETHTLPVATVVVHSPNTVGVPVANCVVVPELGSSSRFLDEHGRPVVPNAVQVQQ